MDEATAFHTAVRRYCESEFARSPEGVVTVRGTGRFGDMYYASPLQFAEAALVEVEKLILAQFQSMEDLRPLLLRAGELAQEKIAELADAETKKVVADQAGHYRAYIMGLTGSDLANIEPLPHRRTLDEDERHQLWDGFRRRWDVDLIKRGINLLFFHDDLFKARHGVQILRDALIRRGISKVLQFHDVPPDLEIDVSIFDPRYGSGEVYSTSHAFDWLVYAHHESAIGISDEWLEETFRQQWPDWRERIYEGPYSTADLRGWICPVMKVACHVETDLSFDEFAATFAHSEWRPNVGRYAVDLTGPLGECKFVRSDDGYLLEDSIEAFDVESAARSLSAQLSSQGLRHKLEVYDASDKLILYLHHDPPREG